MAETYGHALLRVISRQERVHTAANRRNRNKMARLSYSQRKNLPSSAFAVPSKRKFPVEDPSHARNALARVSQYGSPAEKAAVKAKVRKRYPGIGQK